MRSFPVNIKCPQCGEIQCAEVKESFPWYDYTHRCSYCSYWITESEWEEIEDENFAN